MQIVTLNKQLSRIKPWFRSGFEDGDAPFDSYTSGGVTLNTQAGNPNGGIAAMIIDESSGLSFGTGPTDQAILGYGRDAFAGTAGTQVVSFTDTWNGKPWTFESQALHPDPWKLYDDSGYRCMRCTGLGGKAFAWDCGRNLSDDTKVFYAGMSKAYGSTNAGQWKGARVANGFIADGLQRANSFYTHNFLTDPNNPLFDVGYNAGGGASDQTSSIAPCKHPETDNIWTLQTYVIYSGHFDTVDGTAVTGLQKSGGAYSEVSINETSVVSSGTNVRFLQTTTANRWRWFNIQAYIDNPPPVQEMQYADTFFQIGSFAHLRFSDNINPALGTHPCRLPVKVINSKLINFPNWRGLYANFSAKYYHYFDDNNQHVFTIASGV